MAVVLTNNETLIKSENFTTNLLLYWLKSNFAITSKRIVGDEPNTILGLIPFGKNEVTFPLKSIAGIIVSTKFNLKRFIFGLIFTLWGLGMISDSFIAGIILLLLGLLPLLNSLTTSIQITNNAGQSPTIQLSILEKDKAQKFAATINDTLANMD